MIALCFILIIFFNLRFILWLLLNHKKPVTERSWFDVLFPINTGLYKDIVNLLVNVAVPKNYVQTLRSLYFIQSKIRNISFWLEPFRWCCQRNNFFQLLLNKLIKMSSLYWIPVFMNNSLVFRLWAFASSFILGSFILLSTPPTIWMGGLAETCRK